MKRSLYLLPALLLLFNCSSSYEYTENWCDQPFQAQFAKLKAKPTSSDWYKVYEVGKGVYAIAEPYNFQEVISYLILGTEEAVMFDTGMGLSSIASVVKELTDLPITVINSHTHYDHMGGNYEFDKVLSMNTDYTRKRAKNGMNHSLVAHEVTTEAICLDHLPELDTATHHIKPFIITDYLEDGTIIDIGNRQLQVISVPGHTVDAIALLDEANGYLWTGDTFYEAPIWLFDDGTDLAVYQRSIEKLAKLAGSLTTVFPAHNTPVAEPIRLAELTEAFAQVLNGTKKALGNDESAHVSDNAALFEFEHFSFMIRKDLLKKP